MLNMQKTRHTRLQPNPTPKPILHSKHKPPFPALIRSKCRMLVRSRTLLVPFFLVGWRVFFIGIRIAVVRTDRSLYDRAVELSLELMFFLLMVVYLFYAEVDGRADCEDEGGH